MRKLCQQCSSEGKWLPTPIGAFEEFLSKFIAAGRGVPNVVALRKNIAYNLQYLQFQKQVLLECGVTQVITTQVWKVHIIVGTSIIEALLYYLLTSTGLHKTQKWEEVGKSSSENKFEGKDFRIENTYFRRPVKDNPQEMTLDWMIKKAESKKLLGSDHNIYKKLVYLRKLRNRVHIHAVNEDYDTDWLKINKNEVDTVRNVLYMFFTSSLFKPSQTEKGYFEFLL
ncbi:MAG: hypothetical protein RKH07_14895 [Gammaproteobacteria bacterium]